MCIDSTIQDGLAGQSAGVSHLYSILNTQQSYNAQDLGSIIRHKGAIRGSRLQMGDVYKGIIHGYLTVLSAVWAALLPVLER